ncbi:MAG: undecaprenyldiphospho-muramoylpentapeptide beta-N-acetylglucosaminyltransferase [Bacteriovoracia bacterium]
MKMVITGGGTGGHIFGGIAIAQEFLQQSKANEVLFIGSDIGLETKLVPKAGFKLETIHVGKLVGQSFFTRLLTLFQIPFAVLRCMKILRSFQAECVVGVGGFAAGPCFIAAKLLRIPAAVLEQNSVMGFTNKIAAALSKFVFTAFPTPPMGAPQAKCVFTGNPVRSNFRVAKKENKIDDFVVFAFGGSQGASGINKLLTGAINDLPKDKFRILHQTGEKDYETTRQEYQRMGWQDKVQVFKFIDDMQSMYDQADIVVCRAGSSTISELGATRSAAVFVPFPFAARNHQEINARMIEKAGAARVLIQGKSTPADLSKILLELSQSPEKVEQMRSKMVDFYRADSAYKIVSLMQTKALIG